MSLFKFLSKLTTFLLVVSLIIATILAIASKASGNTPKFFGHSMMLVLSGSMEPTIKTGSAIFVEDIEDPTTLKKGDVITFMSPVLKDTIFTHRILGVKGSGKFTEYITKGDNNPAKDPLAVPNTSVLGKYSGITIPYLGHVMSLLQSKKGLGLMLIIPGLLIILVEVISMWRFFSKWERQKKVTA
ncbi:signal peptidase I [Ammoniphilus sp. CFH 90114]|uniref:signal peptidase I n=1 Tax=Ammoniphilus sp. CFH 90114 TaxID=2493665 RepID=UPI00100EB43D|nr:signal peptidase I [Ammoniphilus sp. CFH 90114]RXS99702.1 signal peptidase I [Ammoniphilus sp. CFH 90114]